MKKGAFSHEHIVKFNFKSLYNNDGDGDGDGGGGGTARQGKAKANVYPMV